MNIHPTIQPIFKGYDARPLKGFLMSSNCRGIAEEMEKIGKKEGFKIFSTTGDGIKKVCVECAPAYELSTAGLWAQDYWTFVKNKLFSFENDKTTHVIMKYFHLKPDFTQQIDRNSPNILKLKKVLNENEKKIKYNEEAFKDNKTLMFKLLRESDYICDDIAYEYKKIHIAGGNLYIAKNKFGKEFVIIGENSTDKYPADEIQAMYQADDNIVLPQMDYHIDLAIRPLNNGKILLADDKLMMETLTKGLNKLKTFIQNLPIKERKKYSKIFVQYYNELEKFYKNTRENSFANANVIAKILEKNGFEIIRVPGRIYEHCTEANDDNFLRHKCNYLNANVLINNNGDLVYITNKSNIDKDFGITPDLSKKIDFSIEKAFVDSISPYISKEHFYFIKGDDNFVADEMLYLYQGGIHCACAEIPKNIGNIKDE